MEFTSEPSYPASGTEEIDLPLLAALLRSKQVALG